MSVKIIRPGLLTTIQDIGRWGFQKYGIIVSGAMDTFSFRVANLLVGNDENSACLEITMIGPTMEIQEDSLISICGGNLSPEIDGKSIPLWRPIYVRKGSVLKFGACLSGCRTYLAIAGGFYVEEVMRSKSTYLRAGIGGLEGRSLKEGDIVNINKCTPEQLKVTKKLSLLDDSNSFKVVEWFITSEIIPKYKVNPIIRVIPGGEFKKFSSESRVGFFKSEFEVTSQSDRMGYRLKGTTLKLSRPLEMISEAVSFGTIQVPPEGNPIILLADRQTTGGYPKIAQVASIDIPLIAQVKPGEKISFQKISLEEAQKLYILRELNIQQLKQGINLKYL